MSGNMQRGPVQNEVVTIAKLWAGSFLAITSPAYLALIFLPGLHTF